MDASLTYNDPVHTLSGDAARALIPMMNKKMSANWDVPKFPKSVTGYRNYLQAMKLTFDLANVLDIVEGVSQIPLPAAEGAEPAVAEIQVLRCRCFNMKNRLLYKLVHQSLAHDCVYLSIIAAATDHNGLGVRPSSQSNFVFCRK